MARSQDKLKLGKGAAFVKSQIRRLPQEDDAWEADFCALPKPITQSSTSYLGMVVTQPAGFLLADMQVEEHPTVNDLATLLAHAMRRPMVESSHRPQCILVRGHRQWEELFPHLEEIGVEISVAQELPTIDEAFQEFLEHMRKFQSAGAVKLTAKQKNLESAFPAVTEWINGGYGHIEIGDQEGFGFIARALEYGGLVFEDEKPTSLAEAMASLENALSAWFEREGIPFR